MDFPPVKNDPQSRWSRSPAPSPERGRLHPADWAVEAGAVDDVLREMAGQLRRRRQQRWRALAGGVAALLVAGLVWQYGAEPAGVTGRRPPESSAVVSLPERQILSDGSIVELRNGAEIVVAFTDSVRRVVLKRGEAHFQVAKMTKPFVVASGGVEVRAVGTAFSVQLGSAQLEVVVTEGRVAVEPAGAGTAAGSGTLSPSPAVALQTSRPVLALVDAGNRVVVPAGDTSAVLSRPKVVPVNVEELAAKLAWRVPRLEFSRTPLVEALAMMSQHASAGKTMKVTMADPALKSVQVSGVLRADNIDTLLRLLDEEHGIKAERRGPTEIVLRRGF